VRVANSRPLHKGDDMRVEVVNERNHVDHGLGRKPGNRGGADVVDPDARQHPGQPFTLCVVGGRPGRVVFDDLDRSVSDAYARFLLVRRPRLCHRFAADTAAVVRPAVGIKTISRQRCRAARNEVSRLRMCGRPLARPLP
jgi:hypothetical protein